MNRKIFTFLAVAFMLSMTAYYVNARSVADKSVGTFVKSLPVGQSKGMYHIQVDSICWNFGSGLQWYPVTYDGDPGTTGNQYVRWNGTAFVLDAGARDTFILAAMESNQVRMISANDLRANVRSDIAKLIDIQAALWCTNVVKEPVVGQRPTYHFTNKACNMDLDYVGTGDTYVTNNQNRGWMWDYDHVDLTHKMPLYRHDPNGSGATPETYNILRVGSLTGGINGAAGILRNVMGIPISQFNSQLVEGMIKVSLVNVSPLVLTAEEFNTQMGTQGANEYVKLEFDKETTQDNKFAYYLKATPSANLTAQGRDYLNVQAFTKVGDTYTSVGFITNSNRSKDDGAKYNNAIGDEFLNLIFRPSVNNNDEAADGYNFSYRFVYFPSDDSLVINAFYAKHDRHNKRHDSRFYRDNGWATYEHDAPGDNYFYGLYNTEIHNGLIVRWQDLTGMDDAVSSSMITVDHQPSELRISFGLNSCQAILANLWRPARGLYTIWDERGYCLGVRIHNGTLTPQWMHLDEIESGGGECPDRIPSYQWVIEWEDDRAENLVTNKRIRIRNREFGQLDVSPATNIDIRQVLLHKGEYNAIFSGVQGQYNYPWLTGALLSGVGGYEPIQKGKVKGQYLPWVQPTDCGLGGNYDYSGFRPVNNAYASDQYLGYKHFNVGKTNGHPSFGKSEDNDNAKGMDYNAYAFSAYHGLLEMFGGKRYIDLDTRYNDKVLRIGEEDDAKTGFQFKLADAFMPPHTNVEEPYGYPRTAVTRTIAADPGSNLPSAITQNIAALSRYYYELKVADFYNYRDGLTEQFVVLKGGNDDYSDIQNAMRYGVANEGALDQRFKLTNIYLRETQFLRKTRLENEERHTADPSRRIYYTILDRIEEGEIDNLNLPNGFEVSDVLTGRDGSIQYNLVAWDMDDKSGYIKVRPKMVSEKNIITFSLENYTFPLYRRLRSIEDDGATGTGLALDAPKTLRIYSDLRRSEYLFEDGGGEFSKSGINFLGSANKYEYKEDPASDGTVKYNYHLFVDTAYINRGTGPIKPQYLIAVDQQVVTGGKAEYFTDPYCLNKETVELEPYIIGRYLVNATDSGRQLGSNGDKGYATRDLRYITNSDWDRLVFVDAVHIHDRLYIMSEVNKYAKPEDYMVTGIEDQKPYIDGKKLKALGLPERLWNSNVYGAYYDFGRWENYHNDVCFSLRFTKPFIENPGPDGKDTYSNDDKRFYIESETFRRNPMGNRKIAPVQGGWIQLENWIAVLSRTSYEDQIQNAMVFNVEKADKNIWGGQATSNENVDTKVNIVAGENSVTIYNAAGKQVTIANMLGQTVAQKILGGNNEAISVPKGVAVVNIEGEKAVKVIIK